MIAGSILTETDEGVSLRIFSKENPKFRFFRWRSSRVFRRKVMFDLFEVALLYGAEELKKNALDWAGMEPRSSDSYKPTDGE